MPEVKAPETIEEAPPTPSEDKAESTGENSPTELLGGKFKSADEMVKAYGELETKLGEQGSKLGRINELEDFQYQATPVLDFVANDADTLKKFQEYASGNYEPKDKPKKEGNVAKTEDSRQVQELLKAQQSQIIAQFERDNGLDQLPQEELRTLRREYGKEIGELTNGKMPTLDKFPSLLEKVHTLKNIDKLKEAGKLEGFTEFRKAQSAAISPSASQDSNPDKTPELSKQQIEVARKSGMDPKDYAESLKTIQQEKGA